MERGSLNCRGASCHNLPFLKININPYSIRFSLWLPGCHHGYIPPSCVLILFFVQCLLGRYYASKRESSVSFSPAPNELPVSQFFKKIYRSVWKVGTEEGRYLPVMLSQRMRDVMIRPKGAKSVSSSLWHMVLGMPLTYKLAPLMFSLLGRAKET